MVTVTVDAPPDTIVLTSLKAMLDTVRITAERVYDAELSQFDLHRRSGMGRFIGRDEIDRRRPREFTNLLHALPGVRVTFSRGRVDVVMRGMAGGWCTPAIFIDGYEQVLDYTSDINFLVQPEDVAGVAVYNSASMTPMAFQGRGGLGCGSVAIWTRSRSATP